MSKLDGLIAAREIEAVARAICVSEKMNDDDVLGGWVHWKEAAVAAIAAIAAERQSGKRGEWRCFHCDDTFSTIETAREHFGASQDAEAACKIDIAEYRRLEDQQASCRAECCEEAKRYYAMQADHAQALIREEQKGYDKGLADGRASPLPTATDPVAGVSELADELEDMLAYIDRVANAQTNWLSAIGRHGQWLRVHRDVILAALRARPNEGTFAEGWRPIETAPRDATPILVLLPNNDRKPVREVWWALEYEGGPGYWSTPAGPNGRGYIILETSPSHWRPLPIPPSTRSLTVPEKGYGDACTAIADDIEAMPLPTDPPQLPDGLMGAANIEGVARAIQNFDLSQEGRRPISDNDWYAVRQMRNGEVLKRARAALDAVQLKPPVIDGLAKDLAKALEDAKVYVAIDCDGGSELRIRFEGPYSPERVHKARNADAALAAWRARKGEAT